MVLFAGIAVADFSTSVPWYERLFGRPADVIAHETEVMWHLSEDGWLYVVEDPRRAGHALAALTVENLETTIREISSRGITGGPIEIVGSAGRKVPYTDPDGNTVSFMQVTSQ